MASLTTLRPRRPQRRYTLILPLIVSFVGIIVLKDEASILSQYEAANGYAIEVASKWQTAAASGILSENINDDEDEEDKVNLQNRPSILVVYAGPTDLINPSVPPENYKLIPQTKRYKYHLNTEYFLTYGVQCKTQDTLLVITNSTLPLYEERIRKMDEHCQRKYKSRVLIQIRENKCLDLEAARASIFGGVVNVSSYDYYFYVNCGVSGPAKELASLPWTDLFVKKLNDHVKMTGLSANCPYPHIQSMMYAMDREGLDILLRGGVFFDCLERWPEFYDLEVAVAHGRIVNGYERKMGEILLKAGYAIDPFLRSQAIFEHNKSQCEGKDLWLGTRLKENYGRIPFLNETVFFKSTRYMTPELADEIGFKTPIFGNWN